MDNVYIVQYLIDSTGYYLRMRAQTVKIKTLSAPIKMRVLRMFVNRHCIYISDNSSAEIIAYVTFVCEYRLLI